MVRIVAPAPFEAAPDAPACAVELTTYQPRSGSLPRDNIDQYCEVRLAGNSTSIRLSPDSAAWFRGAEGRQVLACLPCITDEASEVLDALVRSQHHPDSMRQRRHCGARRLVEHLNDVDRTMRSRLSNPNTRCHPLSVGITQLRGAEAPWSVGACQNDVDVRLRETNHSLRFLTEIEMQPASGDNTLCQHAPARRHTPFSTPPRVGFLKWAPRTSSSRHLVLVKTQTGTV